MIDKHVIKNYGKKDTFSSFLPGIAGVKGIPLWCFYVNRGQGVVSFGYEDKNHSIMEFYPAHQAYYNVTRSGFRTFIKKNGIYFEAFKNDSETEMHIYQNKLEIIEKNQEHNLEISIKYYILPNEEIGSLVREVRIKNLDTKVCDLEVIDGMPQIIPCGITLDLMKEMGQTVKAWMTASDVNGAAYYKVRSSIVDSASVTEQKAGNFAFAFDDNKKILNSIVDPKVVFDYDNSLENPINFINKSLKELNEIEQVRENELPTAFFTQAKKLPENEVMVFNEVIGYVEDTDVLKEFIAKELDSVYFLVKEAEANQLVTDLTKTIETESNNSDFDKYAKYTYMDNILRGGYPIKLTKNKTFYTYSRKHGDLERDYNFFSMTAENYSQGNGNYRDVNQNRRNDNFFSPIIKEDNIKLFYNLIQVDGYNPLVIEKQSFKLNKNLELDDHLSSFLVNSFTPGSLSKFLNDGNYENSQQLFELILDNSELNIAYDFKEGYWSDHFTYNLDLIEEYLNIYPEKEVELMLDNSYKFAAISAEVNPRSIRYVKTDKGIRQYNAITDIEQNNYWHLSNKEEVKSTLIQKLILLSSVKFASLDPYGFGIEMEGGKPGWYDALNGLPGIFGSSMNETYEVLRNTRYLIRVLNKLDGKLTLIKPLIELIVNLSKIINQEKYQLRNELSVFSFWDKISLAREEYRDQVYHLEIENGQIDVSQLIIYMEEMEEILTVRINLAVEYNDNIPPSYFYYDVVNYLTKPEIVVESFKINKVANFLEGPVHYLKLLQDQKTRSEVYQRVKNSDLYDEKLNMYKVNASLKDMTYEIGRCKSFSPGWLENESIWLHMEYKYLLQVLKAQQYQEFFNDFNKMLVCFLDEDVYGRSILENSSFIVSSANNNKELHGRGFVARLSGSTAEFLSIYKSMMFGDEIFTYCNDLEFQLSPNIPKNLIKDDLTLTTTLLSKTKIKYHFVEKYDVTSLNSKCLSYTLTSFDNEVIKVNDSKVVGEIANDIRELKFKEILVKVGKINEI